MKPETRIVLHALQWEMVVFIITGVAIIAAALAWSSPRLLVPCPPSCSEVRP